MPGPIDSLLAPYRGVLRGRPEPAYDQDPVEGLQALLMRLAMGGGGFPSATPFTGGFGGYGGGVGSPAFGSNPPYTGPTTFTPVKGAHYPVVDPTPEMLPNPHEVAPEIQRAWLELQARWPSTTNMGTHVVRNIAGTNTLSQHSFGDAADIGGPAGQLEDQASWLARKADELGLTEIIFRNSIWTDDEGWHPYGGIPHVSHVHITGPQTYGDTSPYFPTVKYNPRPDSRGPIPTSTKGGVKKVRVSPYKSRSAGHRL